jgi:hypothetical protein
MPVNGSGTKGVLIWEGLSTDRVCGWLQIRQVLTGLLGFMMYKVAILGCTAVPSPPQQRATEEERLI